MPEASLLLKAVAAAGPIAALLVPVVLLLFVALRLRKKLRYPHELVILHVDDTRSAAFLRTLRLYFDAILDATCAIIIGLVVSGLLRPARQRGAVTVIDCSFSMTRGMRGDRPLDEAARIIFADERLRSAPVFSLGWDPVSRTPTLRDVTNSLASAASPQAFVSALESTETFILADYSLIATLSRRGWSDITLISDEAQLQGVGVTMRTIEAKPQRYLYPASSSWDWEQERGVIRFVAAGGATIEALWMLETDGSLSRAKPEDYSIRQGPPGFELSCTSDAVWVVQWDGHAVPFLSPGKPRPLYANGSFSTQILDALGPIASNKPGGLGRRHADGITIRDAGGAGIPGYLSVAKAETEPYIIPPRQTLGQVVAAGYTRNSELSLGPAALSSIETAIPFWIALNNYKKEQASLGLRPVRVGDGFLYPQKGSSPANLIIPALDEYAPRLSPITVRRGAEADGRLIVALMLATLYALKLWLSLRLANKKRNPSQSR